MVVSVVVVLSLKEVPVPSKAELVAGWGGVSRSTMIVLVRSGGGSSTTSLPGSVTSKRRKK